MFWQTTRHRIDLSQPRVMGIVNVTPDSFSDGGEHASTQAALAHCERLLEEGADIHDIGGESSRPGAQPVSVEKELARVLPVVAGALRLGVPLSVAVTVRLKLGVVSKSTALEVATVIWPVVGWMAKAPPVLPPVIA